MSHKIISVILTGLFACFVYVQFNDTDPLLWILFYLSAMLLCAFAITGKFQLQLILALLLLSLGVFFWHAPALLELIGNHQLSDLTRSMQADASYIERSREAIGAFLVVLAMAYQWFSARSSN